MEFLSSLGLGIKSPSKSPGKNIRKRPKDVDEDSENGVSQAGPCTIERFCDATTELFGRAPDTKHMKLSHVFRGKAMAEDIAMQAFDRKNDTTRTEIQHAFSLYYKKASQTNVVNAESAVALVKAYVNTGESVEMHPKFPTNPSSAYNLYLKEQGIGKFDKNDKVRSLFAEDIKVRQYYEDMHKDKLTEYIEDLKRFLKQEKDLKPEHIQYVNERIRLSQKKIDPSSVEKKKRAPAKQKRERKSAFDFFKSTKKDLYADLEPEARDRKLQKKFDRLPDDMKQIFVDLEQGQ